MADILQPKWQDSPIGGAVKTDVAKSSIQKNLWKYMLYKPQNAQGIYEGTLAHKVRHRSKVAAAVERALKTRPGQRLVEQFDAQSEKQDAEDLPDGLCLHFCAHDFRPGNPAGK